MIHVNYLMDLHGADKFGSCIACGKNGKEDQKMVRVTFMRNNYGNQTGLVLCLCDECRKELYHKI